MIISMAISGLNHSISFKKSFDPVIGETFQATIQSETKDHSCHVYVEQTSHHPPINHFLIEDDDHKYKVYGYYEHKGDFKMKANEVIYWFEGPTTVEFADGHKITFEWPHFRCKQMKQLYCEGQMVFKDETNNN